MPAMTGFSLEEDERRACSVGDDDGDDDGGTEGTGVGVAEGSRQQP